MKKIAIILLSILVAGMFIACNQDVTIDAQAYANMELGTFVLNGNNYATLQAAIDALSTPKAIGNEPGVIYLTKDASGPGAVIDGVPGVKIDFGEFTYSFTNVTATQGSTDGNFGLAIKGGSSVTLAGTKAMNLFDNTTGLTMVYVEGATTSLAVEKAPQMTVADDQFVFWAANGATLTIGGETKVAGGIAATGSTTEESKPTITLTGNSSVTGSINATSAKVNVEETSKIEASVIASENTTVIVNSENNVITTLDKTTDSTVIITEKVQINDVTGEDNEVVIAGDGEVVDASGDESKDVEPSTQKTYAAMVGTALYETFTEALKAVGKEGELFLLADLNEDITIPEAMSLKFNFGSYNIGTSVDPVDITVNGDLYITGSGYAYVDSYNQAEETYAVLDGGTYIFSDIGHMISFGYVSFIGGTFNVNPSSFVPAFCEVTNNGDGTWTVSRVKEEDAVASITIEEETLYFKTLVDAVAAAEDGDTVTLLRDYTGAGIFVGEKEGKNITIDLGGFTYTCSEAVGSTGTETQAWHLEKGNTITIKNGKLTSTPVSSSGVKILVQNYCNLTLTDVELDGTNLIDSGLKLMATTYTLSNNYGSILINGNTSITAAENGVAFDVCTGWGGYTSVSVTVNTTGTIDGIIELSDYGTGTEKVELIVENGVFNSSVRVPKESNKILVSYKGGEFYVSDSYTLESVANYGTDVNIHLLKNITSDTFIGINGARTVNLDLGKNELNLSVGWYVLNGHLSLENGTVTGNMPLSVYGSNDSAKTTGYSELTLKSDATIKNASWAICLFPLGKVEGYGALISVYGKIESETEESTGIFVSGNLGDSGNDEDVAAMTSSNIINITGKINVKDQAIAMNGAATVKISGEANITGSEAVGVKRGTLNVSGGTLTSTGAYVDPVSANNNGTEASGAVISITSTYNYSGQIVVDIESGSLVTTNGCGIYVGHSKKDKTTNPYTKGISLTISDDVSISRTAYSEGTKMVFVADKLAGDSGSYPSTDMNRDWDDDFANNLK